MTEFHASVDYGGLIKTGRKVSSCRHLGSSLDLLFKRFRVAASIKIQSFSVWHKLHCLVLLLKEVAVVLG